VRSVGNGLDDAPIRKIAVHGKMAKDGSVSAVQFRAFPVIGSWGRSFSNSGAVILTAPALRELLEAKS
jgi:hypothetical protein